MFGFVGGTSKGPSRTKSGGVVSRGPRKFDAGDFKIVREPKPHVRFSAIVGRELAGHVIRAVPFRVIVRTCRSVIELF